MKIKIILLIAFVLGNFSFLSAQVITDISPLVANNGDTIIITGRDFGNSTDFDIRRKNGIMKSDNIISFRKLSSDFEGREVKIIIIVNESIDFQGSDLILRRPGGKNFELQHLKGNFHEKGGTCEKKPQPLFNMNPVINIDYEVSAQEKGKLMNAGELEAFLKREIEKILSRFNTDSVAIKLFYSSMLIPEGDESRVTLLKNMLNKLKKESRISYEIVLLPDSNIQQSEGLRLEFNFVEKTEKSTEDKIMRNLNQSPVSVQDKITNANKDSYGDLENVNFSYADNAQKMSLVFTNYEPEYKENGDVEKLKANLKGLLDDLESQGRKITQITITTSSFENQEVLNFPSDVTFTEASPVACNNCFFDGQQRPNGFTKPQISILDQEFLKQIFMLQGLTTVKPRFEVKSNSGKEDLETLIEITFEKSE